MTKLKSPFTIDDLGWEIDLCHFQESQFEFLDLMESLLDDL